jgi:DNA recombination protein RmuC
MRKKFSQEFENLANQIFESKRVAFDTQSREGLNTLLLPFKEQLESFRNRIDQVHTESVQGQSTLKGELGRLQQLNQQITQEASNLTKALKGDKKLQGNWGEQKAELLLEQAGLRKGVEFEREQNFKDDAGNNFRPDFVVKLPEGKHIIIDSKVSLVDYSAFVAAEATEDKQRCLAAHVAAIRGHIKELSKKNYPSLVNIESPGFTFMFIAIEPAYLAAAGHAPSLFQEAFESRVMLVTATTLLPVLMVVANLWNMQRRDRSTQELAESASRVYDKLRGFIEKMDKLGNQLNTAQNTYKETMDTLKDGRGNLVRTVERFTELGVKVIKKLPASVRAASDDDEQGDIVDG